MERNSAPGVLVIVVLSWWQRTTANMWRRLPGRSPPVQQGLDLDVVDEEEGEGEDTRLARAFLMGTSRVAFWQGKLCFTSNVSFTRNVSQDLRPQKSFCTKYTNLLAVHHLFGSWFEVITELDSWWWNVTSHRAMWGPFQRVIDSENTSYYVQRKSWLL